MIGVVSQDDTLFQGSIAENISFFTTPSSATRAPLSRAGHLRALRITCTAEKRQVTRFKADSARRPPEQRSRNRDCEVPVEDVRDRVRRS